MKLADVLSPWIDEKIPDCDVTSLENDSRRVTPGSLFLAYPGAANDGRLFMQQAVVAGARAILYDPSQWTKSLPSEVICFPIVDLAQKLAAIAAHFYHYPAEKLTITGVTGTNGKTTIAYQLAQAHRLLGRKAAYIGTLGQGEVDNLSLLANTTPDALCLQSLFNDYYQQQIKQVSMEVSSHALCQGRVDEVNFKQAIFTNLTQDHLDYHQTMEAYAEAKAMLFKRPSLNYAIINRDDPYYAKMQAVLNNNCQLIQYAIQQEAEVKALNWQMDYSGIELELRSPWGRQRFKIAALGFFNIYNAMAVFTSLVTSGYPVEQVVQVMPQLRAAPGRMEVVKQEPTVIVDYSHTPDSLKNALTTLNHLKKGKLLVVFGCGGDRDKTKRPVMGKIASDYSDLAIITSDNPRHEDPQTIIDEIEAGITEKLKTVKVVDREKAIRKAIELAEKEDIILIAGKGHETYQQVGDHYYNFSDRDVVIKLIHSNDRL